MPMVFTTEITEATEIVEKNGKVNFHFARGLNFQIIFRLLCDLCDEKAKKIVHTNRLSSYHHCPC